MDYNEPVRNPSTAGLVRRLKSRNILMGSRSWPTEAEELKELGND